MEKLEWLPLYIDKLLSSPAWQDMADYERGWYIQLLLRCTRSERLGYLKMDSNLWTIAGAKRRDFFESHKSAVLACFKVREMEGHQWLYNDRLLSVMEDQSQKFLRRTNGTTRSLSLSQNLAISSESKAQPRSIEEVNAYCEKRNNGINAEAFWDFYESKGWKVGNQAMKDWKAAVRTWERRLQVEGDRVSKREQGFAEAVRRSREIDGQA
jgi:hypothetical protein